MHVDYGGVCVMSSSLMPLSHLELVLVHVVPVSHESAISHKPGREVSITHTLHMHTCMTLKLHNICFVGHVFFQVSAIFMFE